MASVLIIDDDEWIRTFLRAVFVSLGHSVREAADGEAGLRDFAQHPTDLVVCDLIMPIRDGYETITELRRVAPTVRILAISGGGECFDSRGQMLAVAAAAGADAVECKPLSIDRVLDAARTLLIDAEPTAV